MTVSCVHDNLKKKHVIVYVHVLLFLSQGSLHHSGAECDGTLSTYSQHAVRSKAAERIMHVLVWNKQNDLSLCLSTSLLATPYQAKAHNKGPFMGGEKHTQLFLF